MNLSRLMILGLLASQGPLHGHQIKLTAKNTEVSEWAGVGVGSLNRELKQLDEEDFVQAVKIEQVGRRPTRTIFEITKAGHDELRKLREAAICQLHFGPDTFAVALLFGRVGDPGELEGFLAKRHTEIEATIAALRAERADHLRHGRINALDAALFERQAMLLETELRWLDENGYPAISREIGLKPDEG